MLKRHIFIRVGSIIFLAFFLSATMLRAETVLNKYVEEGLKKNLSLKEKEFDFEKSMVALAKAKGKFYPCVTFDSIFMRIQGGTLSEYPQGYLSSGQEEIIRKIFERGDIPVKMEDGYISLAERDFQRTRIRVAQPLYRPEILYNYRIKGALKDVKEIQVHVYRGKLSAEIKKAYYRYLMAEKAVSIYDQMMSMLEENLRVSSSMFRRGVKTEEVIFRAKAEISNVEQKKAKAEKDRDLSSAYFNFLLDRPLQTPIEIMSGLALKPMEDLCTKDILRNALKNRKEIAAIKGSIAATDSLLELHRARYRPTLTAVFDYGCAGDKYKFTDDYDYRAGSVVLQWNLFNGFQDRSEARMAQIEKRKLETKFRELKNHIRLQLKEAIRSVEVSQKTITSARERLASSKESFKIVSKKYEYGMAPQIEILNAQAELTRAEINLLIARYEYLVQLAELEYVAGKPPPHSERPGMARGPSQKERHDN